MKKQNKNALKIVGGIAFLFLLLLIVPPMFGFNLFTFSGYGQGGGGSGGDGYVPPGYTPFPLTHVYLNVMNALDRDATYGADDVYVRVYANNQFDFTGTWLDQDQGNAATTGQIDLAGVVLQTATSYDALAYQGDGGTNIYAQLFDLDIPALSPEIASWTRQDRVYLYTEGAFSESACDSATAAFDESSDTVTLNKTAATVQGCLSWDCTIGNSVSGSILWKPVIVFEESSSDPLTDSDDVENIYVSVKTGSGMSFPAGDLVSQFQGGVPIPMTSDNMLESADGGTITVKICLPAAEADVGTGDILMHFDDMGDYRAKDLDNDVRAAVETTTFDITT